MPMYKRGTLRRQDMNVPSKHLLLHGWGFCLLRTQHHAQQLAFLNPLGVGGSMPRHARLLAHDLVEPVHLDRNEGTAGSEDVRALLFGSVTTCGKGRRRLRSSTSAMSMTPQQVCFLTPHRC